MPRLAAALDFNQLEGRNLRAHNNAGAPATPVTGQIYYDNTSSPGTLYYYNGSTWVAAGAGAGPADATTGSKGIVQLAGDLAGTAASPQIAAGVITDVDVNAANKDGASGTASMRTLGYTGTQAMPGNARLDLIAISTATNPVALGNQRITLLADPTGAQDAATKAYVDSVAVGLDVKPSCRVASVANVTVSSAPASIDGVTMAGGQRVLLKNQTTASENGIYVWFSAGSAMVRSTDADTSAEVTPGIFTFIEEGTVNGNTGWVLTTDAPITLATTGLTFTQFSGPGEYVWGNGLAATGNQVDVGGTANRISVAADTVDIAATYVGQSSITTLGTVTTGVWNGTAVPIANGGTGAASAPAARTALNAAGIYSSATHGAGTTITITQATHGLAASRNLIVQTLIDATGVVVIPDVTIASNGDVTISFGVSQSANTIRTTIFG